jgi:two-component system, OmpR family, sensor kinase
MAQTHSIKFQFSLVFLVVLLFVVVLGLFSLWDLKDYHAITANLRDRYLPSTQFLLDLNNFTSDFRAAEATALLTSTPAEVAANQHDIEQLDRRIALAQHSYEHVPNDSAETTLYAAFAAKWEAYRVLADQVLALSHADRTAEAKAIYMTSSRTAYDAASDTLGELTEVNRLAANDSSKLADSAYRQARWLTTLAVLTAGLIVLGGLMHVRRSILAPVLDLATRMRRLAENGTDVDITGVERRDEIGEMARAVVVFRNNAIDLAISQQALAQQASMLGEKLAHEQRLTQLQRNFVSMASHEFRTPLTIIDGHAQRLINARARLTPEDVAQRAGKVRLAVTRMTSVIENLIDSCRLIDSDAELYFHPSEFDLNALVHEICHLHRELSPKAQIIETMGTRSLTMVGDQKLLFQVFNNIISNAVKYSPRGGVIKVAARIDAGQIEVMVQDQGLGIPPADRGRLFERYYRGSNVSGIVGTGIGLYLVKTVIDLHGGTIAVESKEGEGSRFLIRLPSLPPARRAPSLSHANHGTPATTDATTS